MKILILGAGRVGESVAESLLGEKNDITVIDTDGVRLRDLETRFDLRGVVGNGISPDVLAEAGHAAVCLDAGAPSAAQRMTAVWAIPRTWRGLVSTAQCTVCVGSISAGSYQKQS